MATLTHHQTQKRSIRAEERVTKLVSSSIGTKTPSVGAGQLVPWRSMSGMVNTTDSAVMIAECARIA